MSSTWGGHRPGAGAKPRSLKVRLGREQVAILQQTAWRLGFTDDEGGANVGAFLSAIADKLIKDEQGTVEKLAAIVGWPEQDE